ncbi:MAG: tRNA epoxyqueuosine(34) reductase QueG [Planctomycetota bacterium]|nr:MAG: tRNA epoxyqueuosine(34) reductase QueG [Planctomycetota bacterium]
MSLAEEIKQKAIELGFDLVGISDASALDNKQFELFTDWLAFGYAGRMNYMRKNLDKRTNPAKLLKNAQSVICVGLNYTPPCLPSLRASQRDARQSHLHHRPAPMGRVANYALYEDYHPFIKNQLRELTKFITSIAGEDSKFKLCVDSAPVAERALAARAGLGFIGKNHMLINPTLGPQMFLGEIITNLKLQTDELISDSCSNCNKCIEACPTGALKADGQFDANKCISYLTIEYRGQIPDNLAEKICDRLFGCDECVLACPHKKNAPVCKNKLFSFYPDRARLNLHEILDLSNDSFEAKFTDSPIKRLPLLCLKRNAQICLANIVR